LLRARSARQLGVVRARGRLARAARALRVRLRTRHEMVASARPPACCAQPAASSSGRERAGACASERARASPAGALPRRLATPHPPPALWRPLRATARRRCAPPANAAPRDAPAGKAGTPSTALSQRARVLDADAGAAPPPPLLPSDDTPDDYYSLLEVDFNADTAAIKDAYRRLQKACHPDIAGDEATECSVLLNEAFETLSDPALRRAYDLGLQAARLFAAAAGGDAAEGVRPYTGEPFSEYKGIDPRGEGRAVFVDEGTCIGCKNCTHCAPNTFAMEEDYGRARVFAQWADDERDTQTAIDSCPVDCIHWVGARQLAVLEYVMQGAKRVGVAAAAGGGVRSGDPFDLAAAFLRKGREREAAAAAAAGGPRDAGGAVAAGALQGRVRAAWLKLRADVRAQWRRYDDVEGA
jgi:ferredoxin